MLTNKVGHGQLLEISPRAVRIRPPAAPPVATAAGGQTRKREPREALSSIVRGCWLGAAGTFVRVVVAVELAFDVLYDVFGLVLDGFEGVSGYITGLLGHIADRLTDIAGNVLGLSKPAFDGVHESH
jgi:hypothetical protein